VAPYKYGKSIRISASEFLQQHGIAFVVDHSRSSLALPAYDLNTDFGSLYFFKALRKRKGSNPAPLSTK
jgi:hypothetical protein